MACKTGQWHFWIDRGGTFTDVLARDPNGRVHVRKLLSEHPEQYEDAPLHAIRAFLGAAPDAPVPGERVATVKMGTTIATNALLERKGARVALVVTEGFADLLEIGYQERPELFARHIQKPAPLAEVVVEARERVLAGGAVRTPLDEPHLRAELGKVRARGIDSVAVLFLHSFAYPAHERAAAAIARELGFNQVSLSHTVANEIKAVGRGDTTVADAYLSPMLRSYIGRLQAALGEDAALRFMQSNGGLADARRFTGKDAVLSGPAGGVVAYAHVGRLAGFGKTLGFDMGGTSTDVSRFDGRYERVFETRTAGVRIKAPMMHIETVAAGGGSILGFECGRFTVGPQSAGADPGPACYGRGGPPALTDANLVLGRIQPKYFPACFGHDAKQPLDVHAARTRIGELAARAARPQAPMSAEEAAAGFVRIANENMAKPIKEISIGRGYDVREYALVCFGGAGPQHACAIAAALGIRHIVLHPYAGVLSAYGMGIADMAHAGVRAVLAPLQREMPRHVAAAFAELEAEGAAVLKGEGFASGEILCVRSLDLRYKGTESAINVPLSPDTDPEKAFVERHRARYGFVKPGHPIELVNLRVESVGLTPKPEEPEVAARERLLGKQHAIDEVLVHFDVCGENGMRRLKAIPAPVFERAAMRPGDWLTGPALIIEPVSTIVVDPGWRANLNGRGHLVLAAEDKPPPRERVRAQCDPVMLEVFNNLFMSVATQMGQALERASHSANIKERLDFSCAVFDAEGGLVANAPHIPVHLGAMGESVRALLHGRREDMRPGDVYLTNDPYRGGSHLPDLTVITPVFASEGTRRFFVANRGHHADIGGVAPGSMPPFSKRIEEEGVVLHGFELVRAGCFREAEIVAALTAGPYPVRNIAERLSDLRAQVAANAMGARLLGELEHHYGGEAVTGYMRHVRENAAEAMRALLAGLPDGVHRFEDRLDCGARLACAVTIEGQTAIVDFAGTDPQLDGNLNAPPAVVLSAVLYVFRTLVGRPIPLNEGCLDPFTVRIPEGSLLRPRPPAAVAGGNVETSQRICDVLYGALGMLAASQGTMNNFSFGDANFGYYETICGGAGAGPDFDGASAVHTHMTNTRITDPEIIERRYPALLRYFKVRHGSGGPGTHRGGDGVERAFEFLAPVEVSILAERRVTAPFGLAGGASGQPGENTLIRGGKAERLSGHAAVRVSPGDAVVLRTPGGGGYGPPPATGGG